MLLMAVACQERGEQVDVSAELDSPVVDESQSPAARDTQEIDETEIYYSSGLEAGLRPNPEAYSYIYIDSDVDRASSSTKAEPTDPNKVYSYGTVDQPPLFGNCNTTSGNPEACINRELTAFFRTNVDYPDQAKELERESVQYVVFTIDRNGQIMDEMVRALRGTTEGDYCPSCARSAINAVKAMPAWKPAMRGDQAVAVRVVLPVRFEIVERNQ